MSGKIQSGITTDTITISDAEAFVMDPGHGAITSFSGVVRDFNQGRDVVGVTYDVFEALGNEIMEDLCKQAMEKWGRMNIYCMHYKGRLDVGGVSVIIAVSTPHRDEAFQACRFLIEEIKHQAPVWKQEHYVDGDSEWTQGCELCGDVSHDHNHHDHNHDHHHAAE